MSKYENEDRIHLNISKNLRTIRTLYDIKNDELKEAFNFNFYQTYLNYEYSSNKIASKLTACKMYYICIKLGIDVQCFFFNGV